jgi:hypothetical protein
VSPDVHSCEHAVALQIDDLLGLQDRKGSRVIPILMRVGPNEPVLFRAVGEVLLDDPRGLIMPLRSVREQPVTGIGLKMLATTMRTSRDKVMRRADELGVSLAIRDEYEEAGDTRTLRRTDGLVDPLLERLKRVHGDRK